MKEDAAEVLKQLPAEAQARLAEFMAMSARGGEPVHFDEIAYLKAAALLNRQRRGET